MIRFINIILLLTFQLGYLEWGKDKHNFIFQTQYEIFSKATSNPGNFLHPLILLPFLGELIILFLIFQKTPNRMLNIVGLLCLSITILLLFFIGVITPNFKIFSSTIPFILTGSLLLYYSRK